MLVRFHIARNAAIYNELYKHKRKNANNGAHNKILLHFEAQIKTYQSIFRFNRKFAEVEFLRLHRCWWRMLETKCVGDSFEMLMTVLAILVIYILYLSTLAPDNNITKMSPISRFCHLHPKDVTNIEILSLTFKNCHQDKVTNIHLSPRSKSWRICISLSCWSTRICFRN